ncbi:MAG: CBS domain-containing protein [Erysipelotrichia bacterium]|jgi:predicted transcriptional regulator|nr:CBS domain-containing protein [Erysipelotrichia bacterium]
MENVQDFIELMQKIEDELRLILKVKYEERLNLGDLLNKANSGLKVKQSIISELDIMREVRNLLSHRHKGKQVIAIPSSTIEKLKSILQDLENPPKVNQYIARGVDSCQSEDNIKNVLEFMVKNDYSQVPVLNNDKFVGLLTTNTISRWLGYKFITDGIVDIENSISQILNHSENERNYIFISRDSNLSEVIEIFSSESTSSNFFDAILITENGKSTQKLLGIITKSDLPQIVLKVRK